MSVANYLSSREDKDTLDDRLSNESKAYVFEENKKVFDFSYLSYSANKFLETFNAITDRSSKQKDYEWAQSIQEEIIELMTIGIKFSGHIAKIAFQEDYKTQLVQRVSDAQKYFEPLLTNIVKKLTEKRTRLKGVKGVKTYITELKDLEGILKVKLQKMAQATDFSKAIINKETFKKRITKFDIEINKEKKEATHIISFQLFKAGLPIKEIAKERHLVPTTIETHLAKCVEEDLIPRNRFISEKDIKKIVEVTKAIESTSLAELHEHFGPTKYSYFKLRLAVGTIND